MTPKLTPTIGRDFYRWFVALLPLITGTLIVLQAQVRARELDGWALAEAGIGLLIAAIGSVVAASAGVARAGTEQAEIKAEVASGENADADPQVETNP